MIEDIKVASLIIISYLFICLMLPIFMKRKGGSIASKGEFTNIPIYLLTATFIATDIGGGSTIGAVEKMYKFGVAAVIVEVLASLEWYIGSHIFPKGIMKFKNCKSLPDVLRQQYGREMEIIASFLSIFMCAMIISIQIEFFGEIACQVLGMDKRLGMIIFMGTTSLYTMYGGIRGVVLTDMFQLFIFLCGMPIVASTLFSEQQIEAQIISKAIKPLDSSYTTIFLNTSH